MAVTDLHKGKRTLRTSAAAAPPIRPSVRGTPPFNVQSTPVPVQAMHFSRPRRLMFAALDNSFSSRLAISLSPEWRGW
jgi:hypothetical protein